jgi:ubiquitin carboxyl-terminal hydrolase 22/27/51
MAGKGQCDSQEWFMMIVDRLHESIMPDLDDSGLCNCFFHKVFYGRLHSKVICDICNTSSSNQEAFSSISLDFKKQAKKKRKALPDTKVAVPSIMECLQSYTALEPLSSEGYNCRGCGTPRSASKQLRIGKLPAILCIHIKRFGIKQSSPFNEEKYEGKIDFPLSLDMAPYTTKSGKEDVELLYNLESVIVHQGEQISNGHYYSFCRQDGRWFRFDDEIVSATTVEDVLRQDAYLLFYAARTVHDEVSRV